MSDSREIFISNPNPKNRYQYDFNAITAGGFLRQYGLDKDFKMKIYEVLKADGLTDGFNFDAKNCHPSNTLENMFESFSLGMNTFAFGLIGQR